MKRIHVKFVLPVLLTLLSPAVPALAGDSVPLKGVALTAFIGREPAACGLVFTNMGFGQATHLGMFTLVDRDCGHPPTYLNYDGNITLTAANGDQVMLATNGVYDLGTKVETASFTVTGGTGRFQDATGAGSLIKDYASRIYAFDGTIDFKKP